MSSTMPAPAVREAFFETGLEILADQGFGGLKLAELCRRQGVTTGSFYHYFADWATYTRDLVNYWRQDRTVRIVDAIRTESDPRRRITSIIEVGLSLPHNAEAAIRAWSSVDREVGRVQAEVDQERFDILYESALAIAKDARQAQIFAAWSLFVFIGYEQSTMPREGRAFEWICNQMLEDLEAGRLTDVPPQ